MADEHPIPKAEFDAIYARVPRLTVEVIVRNMDGGGIYLTRRAIEPCKGQWSLPGGTVRFGEPVLEAVKRVAKRELGIVAKTAENKGFIEYPSHYQNGMDSPVGLVFEVTSYTGQVVRDKESSDGGWFTKLPQLMHAEQDVYLLQNHYIDDEPTKSVHK